MRYVMRIAEFSESSNLWTQIALLGWPRARLFQCQFNLQSTAFLFTARARGGRLGVPSCSLWMKRRADHLKNITTPIQVAFPLFGEEGSRHKILSASAELTFECLLLCGLTTYMSVLLKTQLFPLLKKGRSVLWIRPEMKRDYPLNLSILIRGGKETNKDSPSNGEWSGKSSNWKSVMACLWRSCNLEVGCQEGPRNKSFETGYHRGWESRLWTWGPCARCLSRESGCLGVQL